MFSNSKPLSMKKRVRNSAVILSVVPIFLFLNPCKNQLYGAEQTTKEEARIQKPASAISMKELKTRVLVNVAKERKSVKGLVDTLFATGQTSGSRKDIEMVYKRIADAARVPILKPWGKLAALENAYNRSIDNWLPDFEWVREGRHREISSFWTENNEFTCGYTKEKDIYMLRINSLSAPVTKDNLKERIMNIQDKSVKEATTGILDIAAGKEEFCGPINMAQEQYASFCGGLSEKDQGKVSGQVWHLSVVGGKGAYIANDGKSVIASLRFESIYVRYLDKFIASLSPKDKKSFDNGKPITVALNVPEPEAKLMQQALKGERYGVRLTALQSGSMELRVDYYLLISEAKKIAKTELNAISEVLKADAVMFEIEDTESEEYEKNVMIKLGSIHILQELLEEARRYHNLKFGTHLYDLVARIRERPGRYGIDAAPDVRRLAKKYSLAKLVDVLDRTIAQKKIEMAVPKKVEITAPKKVEKREEQKMVEPKKEAEPTEAKKPKPAEQKEPIESQPAESEELNQAEMRKHELTELKGNFGMTATPAEKIDAVEEMPPDFITNESAPFQTAVDTETVAEEESAATAEVPAEEFANLTEEINEESPKATANTIESLVPTPEQNKMLLETKVLKKFRKQLEKRGILGGYTDQKMSTRSEILEIFKISSDSWLTYTFDLDIFTPKKIGDKKENWKTQVTVTLSAPDEKKMVQTSIGQRLTQ